MLTLFHRILIVGLAYGLVVFPSVCGAGETDEGRFGHVERWAGTVTVRQKSITKPTPGQHFANRKMNRQTFWSMSLKVEAGSGTGSSWLWKNNDPDFSDGKMTGTYSFTDKESDVSMWRRFRSNGSGAGDVDPEFVSIDVDWENRTYSVMACARFPRVDYSWKRSESSELGKWTTESGENVSDKQSLCGLAQNVPLPDAPRLSGSRTERDKTDPENHETVSEETTTISWNLQPQRVSEYEVEIEVEGLDQWLPAASRDASKAGSKLPVRAVLKDAKTGGKPKQPAEKFLFELFGTSKEPGVAMNWPPQADAKEDFDLRFEPAMHPELDVEEPEKGQKARTREPSEEASAVVSSFDWGAFGHLRVVAVMPDGEAVEGRLKGTGQPYIALPARAEGSMIADAWKKSAGVADSADADDEEEKPFAPAPECALHRGDGLTLYEEYRGFYENGAHFRADPARMDFFVVNKLKGAMKAAAEDGIRAYAAETKLAAHSKLRENEAHDRQINFNFDEAPVAVAQHGVVIEYDAAEWGAAALGSGPGTPAKTERIAVGRGFKPSELNVVRRGKQKIYTRVYPAMIAHELLHASNVWHHGDRDLGRVTWLTLPGPDGLEIWEAPKEGEPRRIDVSDESGRPIRAELFKNDRRMHVANQHGQHSGFEDCMMRYEIAGAYDPSSPPSLVRHLILKDGEMTGVGLCATQNGSGVNDKNRQPRPRFGDADRTRDRGNCRGHVCINDLYEDDHPYKYLEGDLAT